MNKVWASSRGRLPDTVLRLWEAPRREAQQVAKGGPVDVALERARRRVVGGEEEPSRHRWRAEAREEEAGAHPHKAE